MPMSTDFLPTSRNDLEKRGWDALDIILVTGDAYVDHPSFGAAVIGRVLEAAGFRVGIIAQPGWHSADDFRRLGRPRLFFGITSGNVDSMVANYTANKRPRQEDAFSPGGTTGLRPDRAVTVYANRAREAFGDVPIVVGGIEASLRRLAHYDYWDNAVRRSLLFDARADMLVYGMGESAILEIARRLRGGESITGLDGIRGTAVIRKTCGFLSNPAVLPSFEEIKNDGKKFNEAFRITFQNQSPVEARPLVQKHGDRSVVCFPPPLPLKTAELDRIYGLPYRREWHPAYDGKGGVPGLETVRFSLVSHRGCCGGCSFCSLYFHQGRIVQSRSEASILGEAKKLSGHTLFRGTITDMGGPTANLYGASCPRWEKGTFCGNRRCLVPEPCKSLDPGYDRSIKLYRKVRQLPKVKHAFIGSGFRYDLLVDDRADAYLREVCRHHISGRMKVAPEHMAGRVLEAMGKPSAKTYERFVKKFAAVANALPRKCYLVNYFVSSHPGATMSDALHLARYLIRNRMHPEQVQDFIPLPMTLSGCMYHTGVHPFTNRRVYCAKTFKERKMQRALVQYRNPSNKGLIAEALKLLKAEDLRRTFFS